MIPNLSQNTLFRISRKGGAPGYASSLRYPHRYLSSPNEFPSDQSTINQSQISYKSAINPMKSYEMPSCCWLKSHILLCFLPLRPHPLSIPRVIRRHPPRLMDEAHGHIASAGEVVHLLFNECAVHLYVCITLHL